MSDHTKLMLLLQAYLYGDELDQDSNFHKLKKHFLYCWQREYNTSPCPHLYTQSKGYQTFCCTCEKEL